MELSRWPHYLHIVPHHLGALAELCRMMAAFSRVEVETDSFLNMGAWSSRMSFLCITVVKATMKDSPYAKEGKFNYPSSCGKWQTPHSHVYSPAKTTTVIVLTNS